MGPAVICRLGGYGWPGIMTNSATCEPRNPAPSVTSSFTHWTGGLATIITVVLGTQKYSLIREIKHSLFREVPRGYFEFGVLFVCPMYPRNPAMSPLATTTGVIGLSRTFTPLSSAYSLGGEMSRRRKVTSESPFLD